MKTSITDTNTAADVCVKCIFPSILTINYNHSMLQYNLKLLFVKFNSLCGHLGLFISCKIVFMRSLVENGHFDNFVCVWGGYSLKHKRELSMHTV